MRAIRAQRALSALFALVAASIGCATTPDYLRDRGADLGDIVQCHAVASVGADAKLECTRLIGIGGGLYEGYAAGYANRQLGVWRETVADMGWPNLGLNMHFERIEDGSLSKVSGNYDVRMLGKKQSERPDGAALLDWLTLRVTAVLFVGLDAELRLGQAFDFAAGVFGRDPSGDDPSRANDWTAPGAVADARP